MIHLDAIRLGRFELRPAERLLLQGGLPCHLGGRAFDVLLLLYENRHRTVSRAELLEKVWPGLAIEPNNLQVQIWALRRLLGHAAIVTVPRRGYRFVGVAPDPAARPRRIAADWGAANEAVPRAAPMPEGDSQRPRLRWRSRLA